MAGEPGPDAAEAQAAALLVARGDGVELALRVTPKGGRDRIDGLAEDAEGRPYLKIRVSAPPEDGAANRAVTALLAKSLGAPKSAVSVVAGATARMKRVAIEADPAALRARLAAILAKL